MIKYLVIGAGFAFAAAVQPGPFQAYLLNQSLTRGWRRTLPASLAPLVSDAPIILITLLLISKVPPDLVRFLHLLGAVFLFYLTWGAFQSWRRVGELSEPTEVPGSQTLWKAAVVNFLNPNPWLGWSLVMGPIFLEGMAADRLNGPALLLGFYGTMTLSQAGLIILMGQAGRMGSGFRRATLALSVFALGVFGFYQLWLGLSAG